MSIGVLIVAVSAAGFAITMFGRRPPLQPATTAEVAAPAAVTPSRVVRRRSRDRHPNSGGHADSRTDADEVPRLLVEVPSAVRVRAAFLLGLGVVTAAAVIGVVMSVVIVGGFTLLH
ncbi:MAG: hypothetical protein JST64_13020 [Actinobacteria bacterium]|nr:hypothetical protein [Actinomycetota bacterium]